MGGIAFYAPMKPPTDPVPSGDRTMARALMTALGELDFGAVHLISEFGSREGKGDPAKQEEILATAEIERKRIAGCISPALWLTYHSYYKAPDLIGPTLSRHWRIPYVLVEATRARSRLHGSYARFAAEAEAACDAADVIFWLTERDRFALQRDRPPRQNLIRLRPFLDLEELPPITERTADTLPVKFLTCGMFRPGDKMKSYEALASALALVHSRCWQLTIVGDGPKHAEIMALFSRFGERVTFAGSLTPDHLAERFASADAFLWPGVNEAFGMVYLEAQAQGCPVLAEDRSGVRDVVRDGGWLVAPDDPPAYAAAIERIIKDPDARVAVGRKGRAQIADDHLLGAARTSLKSGLDPLMEGMNR